MNVLKKVCSRRFSQPHLHFQWVGPQSCISTNMKHHQLNVSCHESWDDNTETPQATLNACKSSLGKWITSSLGATHLVGTVVSSVSLWESVSVDSLQRLAWASRFYIYDLPVNILCLRSIAISAFLVIFRVPLQPRSNSMSVSNTFFWSVSHKFALCVILFNRHPLFWRDQIEWISAPLSEFQLVRTPLIREALGTVQNVPHVVWAR